MIYDTHVVQTIRISVDETKFDEQFMEEFRASFFPFHDLVEHVEHIAQLQARGVIDLEFNPNEFIEGYGPANEMGIKLIRNDVEVEDCGIVSEETV
jgi:hypothetical protein